MIKNHSVHRNRPVRPSVASILVRGLLLFISALFIFGQTVKVEDGVTVVRDPKNPVPPPGIPGSGVLVEELTIGAEGGDENALFSEICAVTADDEGNIYIADYKEATIKVFDERGKFLRVIGRRGQGPGEFQNISGLNIAIGGTLVVRDDGNRRFAIFSKKGELLKEIQTALMPLWPRAMDSEGRFIGVISESNEKGETQTMARFDPATKELIKYGRIFTPASDPFKDGMEVGPKRLVAVLMPEACFAWAVTDRYEITIIGWNGKTVRKIIRDYEGVPVSEEYKNKFLENLYKQPKGDMFRGIKYRFPKEFDPISVLAADEKGRLFVEFAGVGETGETDVFGPDGRLVARIQGGVSEIHKDKGYGIMSDKKDGIPLVKRYRIEWK